jgi:hypothetical protein
LNCTNCICSVTMVHHDVSCCYNILILHFSEMKICNESCIYSVICTEDG